MAPRLCWCWDVGPWEQPVPFPIPGPGLVPVPFPIPVPFPTPVPSSVPVPFSIPVPPQSLPSPCCPRGPFCCQAPVFGVTPHLTRLLRQLLIPTTPFGEGEALLSPGSSCRVKGSVITALGPGTGCRQLWGRILVPHMHHSRSGFLVYAGERLRYQP